MTEHEIKQCLIDTEVEATCLLGNTIKRMREYNLLTAKYVAEKTGMTESWYRALERGKEKTIGKAMLVRIFRLLSEDEYDIFLELERSLEFVEYNERYKEEWIQYLSDRFLLGIKIIEDNEY